MLFRGIDVKGYVMSVCHDGAADEKGEYESELAMIERNRFGADRTIKSKKEIIPDRTLEAEVAQNGGRLEVVVQVPLAALNIEPCSWGVQTASEPRCA